LRYFKPSATSPVAREISAKAFDVAFWPFSDSALPKSSLDEDSDDGESDDSLFSDDDKKGKGKGKSTAKEKGKKEDEEEVKFEGGMSLEEKKEVGIRLLCLVSLFASIVVLPQSLTSFVDDRWENAPRLVTLMEKLLSLNSFRG
jgi:hypothetical protein